MAARKGETGLHIASLPLLAARLAGGFRRPARSQDLEPAIRTALDEGGFAQLDEVRALSGMTRSVMWTLVKAWGADLSLSAIAAKNARIADLALIEKRVQAALPPGALTPRELRDAALGRLAHAPQVLASIQLEGVTYVAPVWRPLLDALADVVELRWRPAARGEWAWFRGKIIDETAPGPAPIELVSCANLQAEVVETLRWVRELLASGRARPEEIAIAAPATEPWDEHFLVLAGTAGLPIHFSHGVSALSTREGQACAALADTLLKGLSQDRIRRLLGHAIGQGAMVRDLRRNWADGLWPDAGLFEMDHWRRALDTAVARRSDGFDPRPILMPIIELLTGGVAVAEQAGEALLGCTARSLWTEALRKAPPTALEYSLQDLRVPDARDPGNSVVWCPANHLAGAPRPCVRLLGLTSRSWPRGEAEDLLLPNHILACRELDPDPITERDRRAFAIITARATGICILSRSRHDAQGKVLAPSPLIRGSAPAVAFRRERIPAHAFSNADRVAARRQDAAASPVIAGAATCWADWRSPSVTGHDGRVRSGHPVVRQSISEVQSATSLRLMLRDPLAFVWRYALGWHARNQDDQPLSLDARAFGELVHELLKRTVDALEPQPGFGRSTRHEIEDALTASVTATRAQWPLERSTPPSLLWQHTLEAAATRALAALTFDPGLLPGTRSWTEVPFGQSGVETGADLPWDPNVPVQIPGTNIRICGSIDRLDLRSAPDAVQVSDYKTGVEPKNASEIVFRGGAELQRVIYACATRQLLPEITRVFARLIFLGEDKPNSYRLADVDAAITEITSCVASACTLLTDGSALPGPDAEESWNEFRLALPAAPATYFEVKRSALARAFGSFSRVWSRR